MQTYISTLAGCSWELGWGSREVWGERDLEKMVGWLGRHCVEKLERVLRVPSAKYRSNWRSGRLNGTGMVPLPAQSTSVWDPSIACPTKVEIECARQCPASCRVDEGGGQCRPSVLVNWRRAQTRETSDGQGTRLLAQEHAGAHRQSAMTEPQVPEITY
jgi:hypothetical protein